MNKSVLSSSVVYLVDDEQICRQSMSGVVRAFGYQCMDFCNPDEFLAEIADRLESSNSEDSLKGVVLADFRLPRTNGLQLFEATRRLGCDLPFVLISGHADDDLVETSLKAGVSDFLQKPIDFEYLQVKIAELLG